MGRTIMGAVVSLDGFMTDGVAAAIKRARELAGPDREVDVT